MADQKLIVDRIVEAIVISHGPVVSILNDHFGMRNLSAGWVLPLLTSDEKRNFVTTSKYYNRNPYQFLQKFLNRERNMNSTQNNGDHAAIKTMSSFRQIGDRKVGLSAKELMVKIFKFHAI